MSSILATSSMSSRTPMSALRRSKTRGDSPGRSSWSRRGWTRTAGVGSVPHWETELSRGWAPSRSTLPKTNLTEWVNEATGAASLAAAPGVLYVFRDPVRRETFAASQFRSKGRRLSFAVSADLYREHRPALDALAAFYCDRGRLPRADEFMEPDWTRGFLRKCAAGFHVPPRTCRTAALGRRPPRAFGRSSRVSGSCPVSRETAALRLAASTAMGYPVAFLDLQVRLRDGGHAALPRGGSGGGGSGPVGIPRSGSSRRRPSTSTSPRSQFSRRCSGSTRGARGATLAPWRTPTSSSSTVASPKCRISLTPTSTGIRIRGYTSR